MEVEHLDRDREFQTVYTTSAGEVRGALVCLSTALLKESVMLCLGIRKNPAMGKCDDNA